VSWMCTPVGDINCYWNVVLVLVLSRLRIVQLQPASTVVCDYHNADCV